MASIFDKLHYRGNWNENLFKKTLAVVGTRQMTHYGERVIDKLMPDLVANEVTIISGFMYGIDSAAHKKCLELGGKTIAVLGSGLNHLYPSSNQKLYQAIIDKGGLVISEFDDDFKPTLWSFPQRNRTVARLSTIGILIIEAGVKSGSLITAKLGRQMGKKVFAVPGPITSLVSAGTNFLIKNNLAKMVTDISDILETKSEFTQEKFLRDLDRTEEKIMKLLANEELTIDEIAHKTGISIADLSVKLSMMAMKDYIEESNGKYLVIND
ncbi:MAG TPA: DNA-processing protein DprA [Candidatus Woesebacteria bacterium]|nr:DNA-processing protein DprA [Candidatus Woesebacteria bacterium]HRT40324.1 DNA-processing protein DprA [Candidatus Woesebacteria bacterium]